MLPKLNISKNDRLLIIHADDFGLCHSANRGTIYSIDRGCVSSISIMPPCPAFLEAIDFVKNRPTFDVGVHLTLTSEWDNYKWGPVSPIQHVRSLVNANGFFYSTPKELVEHALPHELEIEMRAQIDLVIEHDVNVTHVDSHMLACSENESILSIYSEIGISYKLPCLVSKQYVSYKVPQWQPDKLMSYGAVLPDLALSVLPDMYQDIGSMAGCYEKLIRELPPGLSVFLVHPAVDDFELQQITNGEIAYGATWRHEEMDFFSSDRCRELLEEENVTVITWKQFAALNKEIVY